MEENLLLEWYQRNRKKYWVVIFLTTGFIPLIEQQVSAGTIILYSAIFSTPGLFIELPFIVVGIILEIAYQKSKNQLEPGGGDEEDTGFKRLETKLEFKNTEPKKTEETVYACPECGSKNLEVYHFDFLKEYHCRDCDYIGRHVKKVYRKERERKKRRRERYICPNCGSNLIKPFLGGFTGQYSCLDCGYVGIPLLVDKKDWRRRNRPGNPKILKGKRKRSLVKKIEG